MDAEGLKKHILEVVESRGAGVLDNFILLLYDGSPWQDYQQMDALAQRGRIRGTARQNLFRSIDVKYRDIIGLPGGDLGDLTTKQKTETRLHGPMSDTHLEQTPRDFFDKVDQASIEAGFDLTEIDGRIRSDNDTVAHNRYFLPIYIILRQQGYTPGDLYAFKDV